LLPQTVFGRYAYASPVTLQAVRELAWKFDTSLAATAIRLVQHGSFPAMVIYLSQGVRKWFVAGPDIPSVLSPRETPSGNTVAGELLHSNSSFGAQSTFRGSADVFENDDLYRQAAEKTYF
jgi:hypothetical protein